MPGSRAKEEKRIEESTGIVEERVKRSLRIAAGHPAWWVVAFFTTLVIDRPLQFLFASQFLTGRRGVFPSIMEMTLPRESFLPWVVVASAVFLLIFKALDYWGQSALIVLAEGETAEVKVGIAGSLRRGAKALARYAATVFPVDLARYALLLLPGLLWLIWRRFDPEFDRWCAYSILTLAWLLTCVPLAAALGVFSELAGREVVLAASRPTPAWKAAWGMGWNKRREVFAAWLPTFAADLIVAVLIFGLSFGGAYLLFVLKTGLGMGGAAWQLISAAIFMFLFTAAKTAHAVAQTFKSTLWTFTFLDLSETVLN